MSALTCQELITFLSDYVDQQLPADQTAAFERHLAICPECEAYLANFRAAILAARRACADPHPPRVPEQLVRAVLASLRRGQQTGPGAGPET